MECGCCVAHLLSLLMNLQYDENMNYDCTLIIEKFRKACNAVRRENERRKGMEDGVFDVPGNPKLEI